MSRLIDADSLMERKQEEHGYYDITDSEFEELVKTQPTAYDVEKVVDEIKAQFGCKDCEYADEFQHPACNECAELEVMDDICDIVKRGGVE